MKCNYFLVNLFDFKWGKVYAKITLPVIFLLAIFFFCISAEDIYSE